MSETPISPDDRLKIRELMGRATLARVRGDFAQALQLAQEALTLNEQNYETHEFIGDVLLNLGRGADAFNSFRRARELNPNRVELEDKLARAALSRAAVRDNMAQMQAALEGRGPQEPKRSPGLAAVASLLCPGLGQIYNGQVGKGAILIAVFLVVLYVFLALLRSGDYGRTVWGVALLVGVYLFAIGDAAIFANKSQSDGAKLT